MENRTILQQITDTLEAAGIGVSGIETWPTEEDGRVSVSMTIRPRPEPEQTPDQKTAAVIDAINAGKAPDDPLVVRDPCAECTLRNCENCQLQNGTPIKLYGPGEAAAAMLAGRVLLNQKKEKCLWKIWENGEGRFCIEDDRKRYSILSDFTGLYEEARYV
jgi:hypothetical protein